MEFPSKFFASSLQLTGLDPGHAPVAAAKDDLVKVLTWSRILQLEREKHKRAI